MGLKNLHRTRHADHKEERGTHSVQDTATAEAPQRDMQLPLHRRIVQLQILIGNHRVRRLLSEGYINRKTGLIQMRPDAPVTTPAPAPTAVENQATPVSEPGEIEIEQGMYLGREDLHSKALPKNQYYASHPASPGWPYTDQLRSLWESGQVNDFADEVAAYQHFTLKLPQAQVDGILGPRTSRKLRETQTPAAPAPAAEGTPAAEGSQTTPATPSIETGTPAPTGNTTTSPTTTTTKTTDDPTVSGHPTAARILAPVKKAFAEYKESEKLYEAANSAMEHAKRGDKATKEEERQTKMGKMEQSRISARGVMDTAREQVAALTEGEFTSAAELKQVKGYINRQLNANTVYYAQGFNANILSGQGHAAAGRTCNMTVMSMMLEALGKSTADYTGNMSKLQSLAGDYDKALGKYNSKPEDLTRLRLPDFLQLVAIDIAGSRDAAAGKITSHAFITDVARSFGLKIVDIKGDVRKNKKGEDEKSFLGTKYASKLDIIGALYRPAESDAYKELVKDAAYKDLKGEEKKAYGQQFMRDFTEKRRLQYIANVDAWTDIDNQTKAQLEALQTELGQPNAIDSAKPCFFDTAFQGRADEILKALGDISTAIPKEQSGKQKKLNALITKLKSGIDKDRKKPGAPPKNLAGLLSGKGSLVNEIEGNLKKYESLKGVYETLGKEGGAEEILPVEDYKASVIPTMQTAIDSGFQVMVNLENHFVRLQSVADDGFVIDDPGRRTGEDNKISWEDGRKHGYFKHYLLVSS